MEDSLFIHSPTSPKLIGSVVIRFVLLEWETRVSLSNNFQSAVASLDRHEKTMAENNRLMEELKYELQVYKIAHQQSERSVRQLQSTESSRINTTTLGTFFLNHLS